VEAFGISRAPVVGLLVYAMREKRSLHRWKLLYFYAQLPGFLTTTKANLSWVSFITFILLLLA
jgi:hypothetical protein